MDYTNYLWYGIIGVSAFLIILILTLIITLLKNRNNITERTDQYIASRCPTCGQILEHEWNRCPFCMDIIDRSRTYPDHQVVPGDIPIGYLMNKAGPERGRICKIENRPIIIGSGKENDIIINDSRISPQHLKIWPADRKFYIQDLKSGQGTRVNNRMIDQTELYDNDLIEVVNNFFIFKVLDI